MPACIEYVDEPALAATGHDFPGGVPARGFLVITEADGTAAEAEAGRDALREALTAAEATWTAAPSGGDIAALWRWRESISPRVTAVRGGKLAEDVAVPLDRLAEAIRGSAEIGSRHGLETMSWGHAGDGNLHATFVLDRHDAEQVERAERAASDVFAMALRLGGSISGEHGIGLLKRDHVAWSPRERELMLGLKRAFDPDNLMNPGKKIVA